MNMRISAVCRPFSQELGLDLAIDTGAPMPISVNGDFDGRPGPVEGDFSESAEWDIGPYE